MKPEQIFISYAREDSDLVIAIEHFLRCGTGLGTWLDKRDLLAGEDWRLVIEQEITNAGLLMLCLSGNSVGKTGFFQKEIKLALQQAELRPRGEVFIMPIRLNPCPTPPGLEGFQVLDLFAERATDDLLRAVGKAMPGTGVRAPREEHARLKAAIDDYNSGNTDISSRPELRRENPQDILANSQLEERQRASRPRFRWGGSRTNHTELTQDFQNEGGQVVDVTLHTTAPVDVVMNPRDVLPTGRTGWFRFTSRMGRLPFPITFEIRSTTMLGEEDRQSFTLQAADRSPER